MLALSYLTADGQDLRDYRYYKLFEDTINEAETESAVSDSTSIAVRMPLRTTHLFDYNFSFVRNARRGATYSEQKTYLNGIRLRYISRSAAMRLQLAENESAGTMFRSDLAGRAFGNAEYRSDSLVERRTSVAFNLSSRNYLAGVTATTANILGQGWTLATGISARTGRDSHVNSIFRNEISLVASAVKRFDREGLLSFTLFFAPSERGARQSSTAEAFALTGDRLYTPSWGYQNGKMRNSHVRRETMPSIVASYGVRISENTRIEAAFGTTFGTRRYGTLEWFDAQTPIPDNYRYMPSYFDDMTVSDAVAEAWRNGDTRYTQINFDELIARNRLAGGESIYAMTDIVERVTEMQIRGMATTALGRYLRISYGMDASYARSRRFKQLTDMLGGEYITDIDHYLIDDDTFSNSLQNNLLTPDRKAYRGDRFGYDYALCEREVNAAGTMRFDNGAIEAEAAVEIGYADLFRRGYYQKELFAETSLGRSAIFRSSPYAIRLAAAYTFSARHRMEFAAFTGGDMPDAEDVFLQECYNNRLADSPSLRKSHSAELGYRFDAGRIWLHAVLYASIVRDDRMVTQMYDDLSGQYCDVSVSEIGRLCYGAEAEMSARFGRYWRTSLAVGIGRYKYANNPKVSIYADTDNTPACLNVESFVGGCTIGGAPQATAAAQISYFNRGWGVNLDANYAGLRYVSPSFTRRTMRVVNTAPAPEIYDAYMKQERLKDAFTIDFSISKTFYLDRFNRHPYVRPGKPRFTDRYPRSRITLFLSVRNLLGTDDIVYSGYESSRLRKQWIADGYMLLPQASRYMYAYPRTYYFSVKFTF